MTHGHKMVAGRLFDVPLSLEAVRLDRRTERVDELSVRTTPRAR